MQHLFMFLNIHLNNHDENELFDSEDFLRTCILHSFRTQIPVTELYIFYD